MLIFVGHMGKVYNDFGSLKGLRKELEKQDANKPGKVSEATARPKTENRRTPEKARTAEECITIGMKVRLMDAEVEGVVKGIGKDFFTVESDGLTLRLTRNEFILVDEADDRKLCATRPVGGKSSGKKVHDAGEDLVVDLHMEKIPGNERVPEWDMLEFQLDYFRQILRKNLKHKGKRIIFIHGDGEGILRKAVRDELDSTFAVSCTYAPANSMLYGTGATIVTIR